MPEAPVKARQMGSGIFDLALCGRQFLKQARGNQAVDDTENECSHREKREQKETGHHVE
jgi:hypothetical protein